MRLIVCEYKLPSDSLRSSSECMCRARRKCGKSMAHMSRSTWEKRAWPRGRLIRKRTVLPSGMRMSAPSIWWQSWGWQNNR
ncbi:hypothetical protein D3C86_1632120 [compost metagenome]